MAVEPDDDEVVYSVAELAESVGLSVRTVRFYQTRGAIPPPDRRGRSALYTKRHADILRSVVELRDKGERLDTIIDILQRSGDRFEEVTHLADLREQAGAHWDHDRPALWTREEIIEFTGYNQPGLIVEFERLGRITRQGFTRPALYLIDSPKLLQVGADLFKAGVPADVIIESERIMRERIEPLVREMVAVYRPFKIGGRLADAQHYVDALPIIRSAAIRALEAIYLERMSVAIHEMLADDSLISDFLGHPLDVQHDDDDEADADRQGQ